MDLDLSVLESLRIPAGPNRPAQPIAKSLPQEPEPQPQVLSRSERSRLNGEKSKGPTTPKGLENSSRNFLKHGLTATKHSVLDIEDNTEFEAGRQALIDEFRPKTLFTLRLDL